MFEDEFLDNLPEDFAEAGKAICQKFIEFDSIIPKQEEIEHHEEYVETYAILEGFLEATDIPFEGPDLTNNHDNNILIIHEFYSTWRAYFDKIILDNSMKLSLARARDKFKIKFGTIFFYEFSDGDLKRIQTLINELREIIVDSEFFDAKHKERILKKLEGLQMELHKKISSLAKLWDLLGEGGIALGKFGKDAKPFVDRIKEIIQITWRTQVRAEELPSATPLPLLSHGQIEVKEPE